MVAVERIRAIAGVGLEGDRYATKSGTWSQDPRVDRDITLIEAEVIEDLAATDGIDARAGRDPPQRHDPRDPAQRPGRAAVPRRRRGLRGDATVRAVPAPDRPRRQADPRAARPPGGPAGAHRRGRRDRGRRGGRGARLARCRTTSNGSSGRRKASTRASWTSSAVVARSATGCGSSFRRLPVSVAARCHGTTRSPRSTRRAPTSPIPVLGPRLHDCASLMLATTGRTAEDILGGIDAVKLRSSMTLFHRAAPDDPIFGLVLDRFYGGAPGLGNGRAVALSRVALG